MWPKRKSNQAKPEKNKKLANQRPKNNFIKPAGGKGGELASQLSFFGSKNIFFSKKKRVQMENMIGQAEEGERCRYKASFYY